MPPPRSNTQRQTSSRIGGTASDDRQLRVHVASPTWHDNVAHRAIRKIMILRLRRLYPGLTTATSSSASATPSLVQRLEWMLYNAAFSLEEYRNERSLERRIQALVTQFEVTTGSDKQTEEARGCKRSSKCIEPTTAEDGSDLTLPIATKRQRRNDVTTDEECAMIHAKPSLFMLNNDESLVANVMSFLAGEDVLRCRAVNRFMSDAAPKMVCSLRLVTRSPSLSFAPSGYLTTLLMQCTRISTLTVTNGAIEAAIPSAFSAMLEPGTRRPLLRSNERNLSSPARRVLREVAQAFQIGACPNLETLKLLAPVDRFVDSSDVVRLLEAFAAGRERLLARGDCARPLLQLSLNSTFLGDKRVHHLAQLFQSRESDSSRSIGSSSSTSSCFAQLHSLQLSNNFIGEGGFRAVLDLLGDLPNLRTLDLRRNILTDIDGHTLAETFGSTPSLPRHGECSVISPGLQTVYLEGNFLDQSSQNAVRKAAVSRGCCVVMRADTKANGQLHAGGSKGRAASAYAV